MGYSYRVVYGLCLGFRTYSQDNNSPEVLQGLKADVEGSVRSQVSFRL